MIFPRQTPYTAGADCDLYVRELSLFDKRTIRNGWKLRQYGVLKRAIVFGFEKFHKEMIRFCVFANFRNDGQAAGAVISCLREGSPQQIRR